MVDDDQLCQLLDDAADAVAVALARDLARDPAARRDRTEVAGQYRLDLVADDAALGVLRAGGVGILSEESGLEDAGTGLVVVVDPVDGSTNAARGIPWYATSLCAVDEQGPRAAVVRNLATGECFRARRGGGATRDGVPIAPSSATRWEESLVLLNGHAPRRWPWRQYRSLGAMALDLCAVADGRVDGVVDCTDSALGPWDYLGAALVLAEVGAPVADPWDRELVVLDHSARRTLVAAGTGELFEQLVAARREVGGRGADDGVAR